MQSSEGPTQDEPLGVPHGARHQHSNLGERWRSEGWRPGSCYLSLWCCGQEHAGGWAKK